MHKYFCSCLWCPSGERYVRCCQGELTVEIIKPTGDMKPIHRNRVRGSPAPTGISLHIAIWKQLWDCLIHHRSSPYLLSGSQLSCDVLQNIWKQTTAIMFWILKAFTFWTFICEHDSLHGNVIPVLWKQDHLNSFVLIPPLWNSSM